MFRFADVPLSLSGMTRIAGKRVYLRAPSMDDWAEWEPHITLQPPFEWSLDNLSVLEQTLSIFAESQTLVPIILQGFGAFVPRVIYINVVKTPELMSLQGDLMAHLEESLGIVDSVSKTRPFAPHMTVAFQDLTRQNFRAAWPEFQHRELEFKFTVSQLTLLVHDGTQWNVSRNFDFPGNVE